MRIGLGYAALALAFLLAAPARASDLEGRVDDILARMTLDEKVGQLNLTPNQPEFDFGDVRAGGAGGVLAFNEPRSIAAVQAAARASRLGVPLLVGLDVIHGIRTMFPVPLAIAASFDPALARRAAELAAREAAAIGINWTFAPMADLGRDPRWSRQVEGFGEDPMLSSAMVRSTVEGFRAGGLAVSLKHFIGYGAPAGGRDYDAATIATGDLLDGYAPAFRAGIEAGAESVMSAFQALNGVPASADPAMLRGLLKDRMGFGGFVVSDWTAIPELINHGVAATPRDAARLAFRAGVDMDMASGLYREGLGDEVRAGRIPEASVTEAARRVLMAKARAGILDRPAPAAGTPDLAPPSPEMRTATREIARGTMVLLQNRGALPIDTGRTRRIAVVGPLASSQSDPGGPHAARVVHAETVSLADGILERAGRDGVAVTVAPGCDRLCGSDGGFAGAVEAARAADLVVAVLGEPLELTGESASRSSLGLPGRQAELLDALKAAGRPIVLVLLSGRPLSIGRHLDALSAVVAAWYPGTEAGHAAADILFGDAEPSGRLPITWPVSVGQVPLVYDRLAAGRPHEPGNALTMRYSDGPIAPLFPFGHGLAYTSFAYSNLRLASETIRRNGALQAQVEVANTGTRPGRAVVQLYVRQRVASMSRPLRQLKAYAGVDLAPGERRTVQLAVTAEALGYHRNDGSFVVEPGPYRTFVGGSSDADLAADFALVE